MANFILPLLRRSELLKRILRPLYHWGPRRCSACGRHARTIRRSVLWESLGKEWDLTPELYEQMDRREGVLCAMCLSNWRVRQLAEALVNDVRLRRGIDCRSVAQLAQRAEARALQVAEINAVAGLHPFLAPLAGLRYSEYGSRDRDVPSEDLSSLSYEDETFDYVLTSDTLEHVPDFDDAMLEIRRVLKPGGKHIFTIPVIWERATRRRAELTANGIRHDLPPSYHAGPQPNQSDYLVFNEFGGDVVEKVRSLGFDLDVITDSKNPLVSVFVAGRARSAKDVGDQNR